MTTQRYFTPNDQTAELHDETYAKAELHALRNVLESTGSGSARQWAEVYALLRGTYPGPIPKA